MPLYVVFFAAGLVSALLLYRYGEQWGSAEDERSAAMPGDAYVQGGPRNRAVMTRAVDIQAEPRIVWPWLAQLGRGAGFYSFDALDNGGRASARHIVSWVPAPQLGDATAIGYLRHMEPGRSLVWWAGGLEWMGAWVRLATDIRLTPRRGGSRLVVRMSGDAKGPLAPAVITIFRGIDSIMACRQLANIKRRVENYGDRSENPEQPETGSREQYQLYEVLYATGECAGVPGKEKAKHWRDAAVNEGVI